jgi:ribonuclease P/MRP protein subunit RPP1
MYEAVHAYPDGDATAARFARTAADYGFEGIVVRTRGGNPADRGLGDRSAPFFERLRAAFDVDVVDAAEIVADDPSTASGAVGNYRPDHTLLIVRGGSDRMNRFAVEQERVDVLSRPFDGSGDFNHVLAKAARDNDVAVEFDLGTVLRQEGGRRVRRLQKLRKLREILDHYGTPFVVSARPTSHLQLRAPREMRAVGEAVGFEGEVIEAGLREWGEIAARNRTRQSDSFVAPGVRSGRCQDHVDGDSGDADESSTRTENGSTDESAVHDENGRPSESE